MKSRMMAFPLLIPSMLERAGKLLRDAMIDRSPTYSSSRSHEPFFFRADCLNAKSRRSAWCRKG